MLDVRIKFLGGRYQSLQVLAEFDRLFILSQRQFGMPVQPHRVAQRLMSQFPGIGGLIQYGTSHRGRGFGAQIIGFFHSHRAVLIQTFRQILQRLEAFQRIAGQLFHVQRELSTVIIFLDVANHFQIRFPLPHFGYFNPLIGLPDQCRTLAAGKQGIGQVDRGGQQITVVQFDVEIHRNRFDWLSQTCIDGPFHCRNAV